MCNKKIKIKDMEVLKFSEYKEVSFNIFFDGVKEKLWFRIYGSNVDKINPNYNAAMVSMLIPAMLTQQNIEIHGVVSKKLFTHVSGDVQRLLNIYEPSWKNIKISVEKVDEKIKTITDGCGTGFSAGIDSFATLAQYSKNSSGKLCVTHILNFNVGAMGRYVEQEGESSHAQRIFLEYKKRLEEYAENQNLDSFNVTSNLDYFYTRLGLGFQKTCTIRNVVAALLFENILTTYLYSSAFGPKNISIKKNYDLSFMDPIILPLLSTESMSFFSSGVSYTRFEKVKAVSEFKNSYEWLDVCVNQKNNHTGYNNCTRCWKCIRTVMDLENIGKLENYSKVFDLNYYSEHKSEAQRIVIKRAMLGSTLDKDTVSRSLYNGYCKGYLTNMIIAAVYVLKVKLRKIFKDV